MQFSTINPNSYSDFLFVSSVVWVKVNFNFFLESRSKERSWKIHSSIFNKMFLDQTNRDLLLLYLKLKAKVIKNYYIELRDLYTIVKMFSIKHYYC